MVGQFFSSYIIVCGLVIERICDSFWCGFCFFLCVKPRIVLSEGSLDSKADREAYLPDLCLCALCVEFNIASVFKSLRCHCLIVPYVAFWL